MLPLIRYAFSIIIAILMMMGLLLYLWYKPTANVAYEMKSLLWGALNSFCLIIPALIISIILTSISISLSHRFEKTGLAFRILLYTLSSIPCMFAADLILKIPSKYSLNIYVSAAFALGISDGFLSELIHDSEEGINAIKRENYVKMVKLIGANTLKHIKNDIIMHSSRTIFTRFTALISSAVVIEYIFRIKGLGWIAMNAAIDQYISETVIVIRLLSIIVFSTIIVVTLGLVYRVITILLDPRLR
jgi:ABC-type dipeptide/oligopeptide/nickel transport system permease component